VLAFQCDLTRVTTFMYGREQSARTYPQLGIPDPHHQLTHHQNDPEKLEKCTKFRPITRAVHRLPRETAVDGRWRRLAARPFRNSLRRGVEQQRSPHPQPAAYRRWSVAGAGTIKGGRHLVYPEGTPLTNLHVTLLDKVGVPVDKLGDSTGKFSELLS
jgi:hypothetical protein